MKIVNMVVLSPTSRHLLKEIVLCYSYVYLFYYEYQAKSNSYLQTNCFILLFALSINTYSSLKIILKL